MSLILIDGSNLAYRAYHTFNNFRNSRGYPTGMIYGFFSILNSYAHQFGGNVVITWEGGNYWRKEAYSDYKAKRKETDNEIKIGFKDIEELCELIGIVQIRKKGYEADDIISFIVRRVGENIRIVSGDKDLIQLIDSNKNILLLRPTKEKGLQRYDEDEVQKEFKIKKKDLVLYLAIVGDRGDNIQGIRGMGPVKTSQFLMEAKDPIREIKEMFPESIEKIDLNIKLIDLLNPKTMIRNLEIKDINWKESNIVSLIHKFNEYEIRKYNPKDLIMNFFIPEIQEKVVETLIKQIEYRF